MDDEIERRRTAVKQLSQAETEAEDVTGERAAVRLPMASNASNAMTRISAPHWHTSG